MVMSNSILRSELELPHTREQMRSIIDRLDRHEHFPSAVIHKHQCIVKTVLEEYLPLYTLMALFPASSKAHLNADSIKGPDAVLLHEDGGKMTIQITVCHLSKGEALGRQMLAKGQPFWPDRKRTKNRETGEIEESGRAFTTPQARSGKVVRQVTTALELKLLNFRPETDALLIFGRMFALDDSWKEQVRAVLGAVERMPYKHVFVGDQNGIPIVYER
jgi:hypothetical protein